MLKIGKISASVWTRDRSGYSWPADRPSDAGSAKSAFPLIFQARDQNNVSVAFAATQGRYEGSRFLSQTACRILSAFQTSRNFGKQPSSGSDVSRSLNSHAPLCPRCEHSRRHINLPDLSRSALVCRFRRAAAYPSRGSNVGPAAPARVGASADGAHVLVAHAAAHATELGSAAVEVLVAAYAGFRCQWPSSSSYRQLSRSTAVRSSTFAQYGGSLHRTPSPVDLPSAVCSVSEQLQAFFNFERRIQGFALASAHCAKRHLRDSSSCSKLPTAFNDATRPARPPNTGCCPRGTMDNCINSAPWSSHTALSGSTAQHLHPTAIAASSLLSGLSG